MEKRKQQFILMVLMPIFLLSLLYLRSRTAVAPASGKVSVAAEKEAALSEDKTIDTIPKPSETVKVKFEGGPRDPLLDLLKAYLDKMRRQKTVARDIPLPKLTVTGLIWNSDMPQAIVNGKVIRVGDEIGGVKVLNIEKDGITVEYMGKAVFVTKK